MNTQQISNMLIKGLDPQPKLTRFTHFETSIAGVKTWVSELNLKNMADISKQTRQTLHELAMLDITEQERFAYMEELRRPVQNLISSLHRHYLKQSIVLDPRGAGIAGLVQQLRAQSIIIYFGIFERLKNQPEPTKSKLSLFKRKQNPLALCAHRALNELGGLLYESKLLYLTPFALLWQRIHEIYRDAAALQLLGQTFEGSLSSIKEQTTVNQEFLRCVLLEMAGTNRLRQAEITKLYDFSAAWVELIQSSSEPGSHDLLLVDLKSDHPPLYVTSTQKTSHELIYINASELLTHLNNLSNGHARYPKEKDITSSNLVDYVAKSIHEPLERGFARHPYNGHLEVLLGLVASHYHIGGKRSFGKIIKLKELMLAETKKSALVDKNLHFDDSPLKFGQGSQDIDEEHLRIHKVSIINISPGGYRAKWGHEITNALKTGEVISLRENSDESWQVGVIRWVQQNPGEGAEFGIEVISSEATAAGVQPARPGDENPVYMRALILPEVKSLNRAASVLTPSYHFSPAHRIKLRVSNQEVVAKLGQVYLTTASFNQYDFTITSAIARK